MFSFKDFNNFKKNNAIITETNENITYDTLHNYIGNFSKLIKKRSLIFLICKNNLESIIGYIGSIRTNNVVALINEKINIKLLRTLIKKYGPDFIFLEKKEKKKIKNYISISSFFNYELIKSKKYIPKKLHIDLQQLISTSGSTGTSKFVRLSKKNVENNTKSIVKYLKINSKDNTITTLPMSYVYGLSIINTHLFRGATIVLNNASIIQKNFWISLQKNKITNFGGVPYIYSILDRINLKNYNLKHLNYTTQAGGKLHETIIKRILEKYKLQNIKLQIMYGAAEATARMSFLSWDKIEKKINSIGKPIPGGQFFIEDQYLNKINEENKIGELVYVGKNVSMGYANNYKDLSKTDVNRGILKTGDMAFKDKDHYYYLVGRKDRYIKVFGLRINLQELEDIIINYGYENMCLQEKENQINILLKKKSMKIISKIF